MVVACIVNIWLYRSALSTVLSGAASCSRMSSASRPPTRKKKSETAPYMRPSFLWSTVNTHDFQPVVLTGRLKAPSAAVGVTSAGGLAEASPTKAGTVAGRSMMAIFVGSLYFRSSM